MSGAADRACGVMQGRMAAMHAHVPALEVRLAALQAELAPLLDRHQALAEALPWARQLVRACTRHADNLAWTHVMCKPAAFPPRCSHSTTCPCKPECCVNDCQDTPT